MAVWAIGRLGNEVPYKCINYIIDLLKDHFWKVKTAACIALGDIGPQAATSSLSILFKILKEGTINRQIVAESIIKLGASGVQSLIEFMRKESTAHYKAKENIAKALATAQCNDANIDRIVELLFMLGKDKFSEVRKAALISLDKLKMKARDSVTYLKARHLLPFYYKFLGDSDNSVRKCSILCIRNFGAQGELLFIEGVTKDKNPVIRKECAFGLGEIGTSSFRTLLLALHDSNKNIREAASKSLLRGMTVQDIIAHFQSMSYQRQGIICSIEEVLNLPYALSIELKLKLESVLRELSAGQYESIDERD